MSNRLFQGVVHQMRDTIDRVVGVIDDTAMVISCSDLTKIGGHNDYISLDAVGGRNFLSRTDIPISLSAPESSRIMRFL